MKPHRLADLANALTAVATQYGHQEQCRERILSVLVDHFAPEHGNRGPELETAVLVDARELEALRECAETVLEYAPESSWARNDTRLTRAARGWLAVRSSPPPGREVASTGPVLVNAQVSGRELEALRLASSRLIYRWDNPARKPHHELRTLGSIVDEFRDALRLTAGGA